MTLFYESGGQVIRLITGSKGQKTGRGLKVEARQATELQAMLVKVNASISVEADLIQKLEGLTATLWDADPISEDQLAAAVVSRR